MTWLERVDRFLGLHDHDADYDEPPMVRQPTMSSKKQLLKQIRDQMDPAHNVKNRLLIYQGFVSLTGLGVLVGLALALYVFLEQTNHALESINMQVTYTLNYARAANLLLGTTVKRVEPLSSVYDMVAAMNDMNENLVSSTAAAAREGGRGTDQT